MLKFFENYFNGLSLWQKIEFCIVLVLAFSVPIAWRLSIILLILWLVVAVVRCFAEWGQTTGRLRKNRGRWWFLLFAMFYVIHCISMLYTQNLAEGWATLEKRLSFLLLPLMFLLFDFSYLDRNKVRKVLYAFVLGAMSVACCDLVAAAVDVCFNGAATSRFFSNELSSEHHTYISMHVCLCIIFCFRELVVEFKSVSLWRKLALVVAMAVFTVFTVLLSSRAGLLCMVAVYLLLFLWMIFGRKMYRVGIVTAIVAMMGVAVVAVSLPDAVTRVADTLKSLMDNEKEDLRVTILRSTLPVAKENWLVGVGVGDKIDVYMEQYRKDNNLVSLEREYNSHNQYIDTLVVTGIAGLALLLIFFVVPAVLAFKNRRFDVVFALFLFMIFFNALFESVFERQAGIMFFVLFFTLMFNAEFVVGEEKESKVLG